MPNIPVVLNYDSAIPGNFGPDPRTVTAGSGDTIVFSRGPGAPPNSKLRITLDSPAAQFPHFSSHRVQHEPGQNGSEPLSLRVAGPFSETVAYRCELLGPGGNTIAQVDGGTGGEIMPAM
jgi:hypothetical protein